MNRFAANWWSVAWCAFYTFHFNKEISIINKFPISQTKTSRNKKCKWTRQEFMPAPARDDQVQRHSICVWLKVASVINNWLCSCEDSRKLMSWGACIHLITREIVLSTISLANVKEKFCFVYFYCTSAERKFVTKNRRSRRFMTLRLNARKNFNDFDSRWTSECVS